MSRSKFQLSRWTGWTCVAVATLQDLELATVAQLRQLCRFQAHNMHCHLETPGTKGVRCLRTIEILTEFEKEFSC